jgi:hypothetical protein
VLLLFVIGLAGARPDARDRLPERPAVVQQAPPPADAALLAAILSRDPAAIQAALAPPTAAGSLIPTDPLGARMRRAGIDVDWVDRGSRLATHSGGSSGGPNPAPDDLNVIVVHPAVLALAVARGGSGGAVAAVEPVWRASTSQSERILRWLRTEPADPALREGVRRIAGALPLAHLLVRGRRDRTALDLWLAEGAPDEIVCAALRADDRGMLAAASEAGRSWACAGPDVRLPVDDPALLEQALRLGARPGPCTLAAATDHGEVAVIRALFEAGADPRSICGDQRVADRVRSAEAATVFVEAGFEPFDPSFALHRAVWARAEPWFHAPTRRPDRRELLAVWFHLSSRAAAPGLPPTWAEVPGFWASVPFDAFEEAWTAAGSDGLLSMRLGAGFSGQIATPCPIPTTVAEGRALDPTLRRTGGRRYEGDRLNISRPRRGTASVRMALSLCPGLAAVEPLLPVLLPRGQGVLPDGRCVEVSEGSVRFGPGRCLDPMRRPTVPPRDRHAEAVAAVLAGRPLDAGGDVTGSRSYAPDDPVLEAVRAAGVDLALVDALSGPVSGAVTVQPVALAMARAAAGDTAVLDSIRELPSAVRRDLLSRVRRLDLPEAYRPAVAWLGALAPVPSNEMVTQFGGRIERVDRWLLPFVEADRGCEAAARGDLWLAEALLERDGTSCAEQPLAPAATSAPLTSLLLRHGSRPTPCALARAAKHGAVEVVDLLLDAGVDPAAACGPDRPLREARSVAILARLAEAGADVLADPADTAWAARADADTQAAILALPTAHPEHRTLLAVWFYLHSGADLRPHLPAAWHGIPTFPEERRPQLEDLASPWQQLGASGVLASRLGEGFAEVQLPCDLPVDGAAARAAGGRKVAPSTWEGPFGRLTVRPGGGFVLAVPVAQCPGLTARLPVLPLLFPARTVDGLWASVHAGTLWVGPDPPEPQQLDRALGPAYR